MQFDNMFKNFGGTYLPNYMASHPASVVSYHAPHPSSGHTLLEEGIKPSPTTLYSVKTQYESCHENFKCQVLFEKNYIQDIMSSAVSKRMYFSLQKTVQSVFSNCGENEVFNFCENSSVPISHQCPLSWSKAVSFQQMECAYILTSECFRLVQHYSLCLSVTTDIKL